MNPFTILNISPTADAAAVMQAAAAALRDKQHSAREIAEARQLLMNPEVRPVLAFLYSADLRSLLRPHAAAEESDNGATALRRLDIFD
jgi:hypothetical protein